MLRELFRIPGIDLPIYGYGLMLALALLGSIALARRLARRAGFNPDHFTNAAILGLLSGIVGARIAWVIQNFTQVVEGRTAAQALAYAIDVTSGGLVFYGGFILATPVLILYARRVGVPVPRGMDIVAPCIVLGLGLGRIGCFLNGCCWGAPCESPPGITFPYYSPAYLSHQRQGLIEVPEELISHTAPPRLLTPAEARRSPHLAEVAAAQHSLPVHPTQLYSAASALAICGGLLLLLRRSAVPGRVFGLMLMLEGTARFVIEIYRVEPLVLPGLSLSMVIAALLVPAGVVLWFAFAKLHRRRAAR